MSRFAIYCCSCALFLVAACSSPSPDYKGVEHVSVSVDDRAFDVYAQGDQAQAIRLNREWGASKAEVFSSASKAIQIATGCTVPDDKLSGDLVVVSAKLVCER